MSSLINFPAITIFARECLEGTIIVGEFRTIICRGDSLGDGMCMADALWEVNVSAIVAAAFAIIVIICVATPLAILSSQFDPEIVDVIEGISKVVAALSLLQLSLELPKFLKVYSSTKGRSDGSNGSEEKEGMTRRCIRFNVAWNIWREVAECGAFMIPFFLTGDNMKSLPLSAIIGSITGLAAGFGVYVANKKLKNKCYLAIFTVFVMVMFSVGLFSGGCRDLEDHFGQTRMVWQLDGKFWSVDALPMTLLKPFGYSDSRTLLQIISFWSWITLSAGLHYRKYKLANVSSQEHGEEDTASIEGADVESGLCSNSESLVEPKATTTNEEGTIIEVGHDNDTGTLGIANSDEDNGTKIVESAAQAC